MPAGTLEGNPNEWNYDIIQDDVIIKLFRRKLQNLMRGNNYIIQDIIIIKLFRRKLQNPKRGKNYILQDVMIIISGENDKIQ